MSIQWNDLRFLLAVGRTGSLSAAAKALGVNKATVGRRVAALEEELGTSLLTRSAAGYSLTNAGQVAVAAAEQLDQVVEGLRKEIGEADLALAGTVRVTAPPWFVRRVIVPELKSFNERHPRIEVLTIPTDQVLDLSKRVVDIGVRNCVPAQDSLLVRRMGDMAFSLYAATSYLERYGRPECAEDLRKHQLIAFHDTVTYIEPYDWLNDLGAPIAFRASDTVAQVDAAVAGLGVAVLPVFLAEPIAELEALCSVQPPALEPAYTVMPPELKHVARVRVVADWLFELFQTRICRE